MTDPTELADSAGPPPGWYPDPEMVGTQRYWDGSQWTEHRAPMGKPAGRRAPQKGLTDEPPDPAKVPWETRDD